MANMKKTDVIKGLKALGIATEGITDYKILCDMLKDGVIAESETPKEDETVKSCIGCVKQEACHPDGVQFDSRDMAAGCPEWAETIKGEGLEGTPKEEAQAAEREENPMHVYIVNRMKKRNTFLADSVRLDRDTAFLNKEIGKRKYKGKMNKITTVKHCEVNAEGDWVTEFDIELKE